ncbi:MAG: type II toxin-antitoxin system VapC family toxin [Deltaproteobacteria bacterium]|nr:type II toxin-antitoxin system VapC family toxin [Deltaproteobacteria bacterium]
MNGLWYFDTGALAKWYLNENYSDEVEHFIQQEGAVAVSSLTITEMRCLLARRRRNNEISPTLEMKIFATMQEDLRQGYLVRHSVNDSHLEAATNLLITLINVPLRTLDALHLALIVDYQANGVATSDLIMVQAAQALNIATKLFAKKPSKQSNKVKRKPH